MHIGHIGRCLAALSLIWMLGSTVACGSKKDDAPTSETKKNEDNKAKPKQVEPNKGTTKTADTKKGVSKKPAATPSAPTKVAPVKAVAKAPEPKANAIAPTAASSGPSLAMSLMNRLPQTAKTAVAIRMGHLITPELQQFVTEISLANPKVKKVLELFQLNKMEYLLVSGEQPNIAVMLRGGVNPTALKALAKEKAKVAPTVSNGNTFWTNDGAHLVLLSDGAFVVGPPAAAKAMIDAFQGRAPQLASNTSAKKLLAGLNANSTVIALIETKTPMGSRKAGMAVDLSSGLSLQANLDEADPQMIQKMGQGVAMAKLSIGAMTADMIKKKMGPGANMIDPKLLDAGLKAVKELVTTLKLKQEGTLLSVSASTSVKIPWAQLARLVAMSALSENKSKLNAMPSQPVKLQAPPTSAPAPAGTVPGPPKAAPATAGGDACAKAAACCSKMAEYVPAAKAGCQNIALLSKIPNGGAQCGKLATQFKTALQRLGKPIPAACN